MYFKWVIVWMLIFGLFSTLCAPMSGKWFLRTAVDIKIISYRRPSSDQSSLALSVRPFARLSRYPPSKASRTVNIHNLIWFNGTVPVYLSKEMVGLWYSATNISISLSLIRIAKCSRDITIVHVTQWHLWCNLAKGVNPNLTKGVDSRLAKPPFISLAV